MIIFLLLSVFIECGGYKELRIGGLFHEDNQEIAFRLATNYVNERYPSTYFSLIPQTKRVDDSNTLRVYRAACNLLSRGRGVVGVFGPSSQHSSSYIQSVCDRKEIPHIETHYNPKLERNECLVNLHPHPSALSAALVDLIETWKWVNFTILYETYESFSRMDGLLSLNADQEKRRIRMKKLQKDDDGSYRAVLNDVKKSGHKNLVLDCLTVNLVEILLQAQQVGMMNENYYYMIIDFDMQTVDLNPFRYGGTNITGIRIVNPENPDVIRLAKEIQNIRKMYGKPEEAEGDLASWKLTAQTALLFDAVNLFHKTLRYLDTHKKLYIDPGGITCNSTGNWQFGYTIINYMKRLSMDGLTGYIKFDYDGYRSSFSMEIVELCEDGLKQVGTWNSTYGVHVTRAIPPVPTEMDERSLFNRNFIVIICLTAPYAMLKETTTQLTGNDRYEGFGIDLIEELSLMLGFNYTFIVQKDGANGNKDINGHWNGMIRKIMDEEADLGITDLTITSEREEAVDFTMPFMNLGISILYRKPEPVPPSLFMFTSPFSSMVWLMLAVAYFLVSLAIFVMSRLSSSEWIHPHPCIEEPEYLVNQFSIKNCLWFTLGSLMQQGSEIAPVGISTRTAAGIWWFFILIMVSSYTANLAAFLTVETLVTPFKNIEELVEHKEIRYGAKKNGATANFFFKSNVSTYHDEVWKHMDENPEDMTSENDEGVLKVEDENYAYLMESSTIEYVTERHCTLAMVGKWLDDKGYGIAMKKGSPYRKALSEAILKLQETGKLTKLKIKWWKEKRGGGNCASSSGSSEVTPLDLKNVGGVFLVLFVGTIFGFIAGFLEMALYIHRQATKHKLSFKRELINELKFFMKMRQYTKTVEIRITDNIENRLIE